MITGTMTETAGGFDLAIATATFDMTFKVVPSSYKSADNHPDYYIEVRTPRGAMMRVGAMWKAEGKSGAAYFSFNITDRRGVKWQANAVRNDTMALGAWTVVPLAGGQTERIMLTGNLEALDDDTLVGTIESYDFAMTFVALPSDTKSEDSHPDFHIEITSPAGTPIRMGSIWRTASQTSGLPYYSMAFHSPQGGQHRANALPRRGEEAGDAKHFEIIPLAEPRLAEAA